MKRSKGLGLIAGIAAMALLLTGCGLNEDPSGSESTAPTKGSATLRIGTTTDVANFNPLGSLSKTCLLYTSPSPRD